MQACKMHAYKMHAYEMHAYEMHALELYRRSPPNAHFLPRPQTNFKIT